MVDALETARSYGINVRASFTQPAQAVDLNFEPYAASSAAQLIEAWIPLTVAINGVNRSMGQPDLYPFVLSEPVLGKLDYVHGLIHHRRQDARSRLATEPRRVCRRLFGLSHAAMA